MPPAIIKVGGAVLRSPEGFPAVLQWMQQLSDQPKLLILSALGNTTRLLERAARSAEAGHQEEAEHLVEQIVTFHRNLLIHLLGRDIADAALATFHEYRHTLLQLITGVAITRELTPRTLDRILHFGELMATAVFTCLLRHQGIAHTTIAASTLIRTDQQHLAARIQLADTIAEVRQHLLPAIQKHSLIVTQGFIGRAPNGAITTLGFEGSSVTAAALAIAVGASRLWILTDVPGIRTADPRWIPTTQLLPQLSYDAATLLGSLGLPLLPPSMIQLLASKSIEAIVLSPLANPRSHTRITAIATPSLPILLLQTYDRWIYEKQHTFHPLHCTLSETFAVQIKPDPQQNVIAIWNVSPEILLAALSTASVPLTTAFLTQSPPMTLLQLPKESSLSLLRFLHDQFVNQQVQRKEERSYGT